MLAHRDGYTTRGVRNWGGPHSPGSGAIEKLQIGRHYDTTYGTLWKDGTYYPRGTRVLVTGLHIEQGFCVRFPAEVDGEPLETWEDWDELEFLAEEGSVESGGTLPSQRAAPKRARCSTTPRTAATCTCTRATTSAEAR